VKGGDATVTVVSDSGDPAGALVYTANNGVGNAAVSQINQLGFSYSGSLAPRLNIPVTSGAGGYVFVEGFSCNDGFGNVAVLTNPNCPVQYDGSVYNNWQQFVAQHPTVQVVANDVNQPYIIQDTTGSGTISNVKLGKSLTGKAAK
jgi:hypothetical protein